MTTISHLTPANGASSYLRAGGLHLRYRRGPERHDHGQLREQRGLHPEQSGGSLLQVTGSPPGEERGEVILPLLPYQSERPCAHLPEPIDLNCFNRPALLSREPFDYQSWREKHFQGMSLAEILARSTQTSR